MSMALKAAGGSIIATASVANADPAASIYPMSLQWTPSIAAASEIIIPAQELWTLKDLYVTSSENAGMDIIPQINIKKDNDRLLDTSEYLDVVLVTSNSRPNGLHANLEFEGASHMTMDLITSVVAGAARAVRAIVPYEKSG